MSTTVDAGHGFESGINRRATRIWLRLFLEISGGAVAIAVALGLLVVLAAAASQAQASPLPDDRHGQPVSAPAPATGGIKTPTDQRSRSIADEIPLSRHVLAAPAPTAPALQLAAGTVLLALGFGSLLSRRGSRLLAGGAAAKER